MVAQESTVLGKGNIGPFYSGAMGITGTKTDVASISPNAELVLGTWVLPTYKS